MVDDGEIGLGAVDRADRRGQTIEIEIVEFITAREDRGTAHVVVQDHDAGRVGQRLFERGITAILDLLAGDNGGGLRHFARAHRRLFADGDEIGGVAVGAFRLIARPEHGDGVEFDHILCKSGPGDNGGGHQNMADGTMWQSARHSVLEFLLFLSRNKG